MTEPCLIHRSRPATPLAGEAVSIAPLGAMGRLAIRAAREALRGLMLDAVGVRQDLTAILASIEAFARAVSRAQIVEDLSGREALMQELRDGSAQRAAFAAAEFVTLPFKEAIDLLLGRTTLAPGVLLSVFNAYERYTMGAQLPLFAQQLQDMVQSQVAIGVAQGWTPRQFAQHAEALGAGLISDAYAETVFRTERTAAYAAGHVAQAFAPEVDDWISHLRYRAVGDGDTRPNHLANDNYVWAKRHPIWAVRLPPNGFNCRCRVEAISKAEARRLGYIDAEGNFTSDPVPSAGEPDPRFRQSSIVQIYSAGA